MSKNIKVLALILIGTYFSIFSLASSVYAYYPPDFSQMFAYHGDADGDEYITVLDMPSHETQANVGLCLDYNTMQSNNDDDRWNTCDVDGDTYCSVMDLPMLYTVTSGGIIDASPFFDWEVNFYNQQTSYPANQWNPFQLNVTSDMGMGPNGRAGFIVQVTITGGTAPGAQLLGRSCSPDFWGAPDQDNTTPRQDTGLVDPLCAVGVSQTHWLVDPTLGLTENAGSPDNNPYGLQFKATGPGTIELHAEVNAIDSFLIPAFSNDFTVTIPGCSCIVIDCTTPGPNPINELSAMQCTIIAGSTPEIDPGTDTCGGSISGTGPWTYDLTPTEAQGPGACTAGIRQVSSPTVTDSDGVTINEVNVAPMDNAPASSSWNELTSVSFSVNPTDPDIPIQTLTCSQVSNGCPGGTLTGCTWSGWTPTEAQGPTSCNVVTKVYDGVAYSSNKTTHIKVNEVNQNPYWTTPPTNLTVGYNTYYSATNGVAADNDLPNTAAGDPGRLSCTRTTNTCSFDVTVTGSGNGSASCNISFTSGPQCEICSVGIRATDGYGATVENTADISVFQSAVISPYNNVHVLVGNDAGAFYDYYGDDTYLVNFLSPSQGLNALHISSSSGNKPGGDYSTSAASSTFYVTDNGGKAYDEDIILLVSINAPSLPPNFSLTLSSAGYRVTVNSSEQITSYTYYNPASSETFEKCDFIYGPQTWKPGPGLVSPYADYPLWIGEVVSNPASYSLLLFVDMQVGIDSQHTGLTENGQAKITYQFQNLPGLAAFNAYGYHSINHNMQWTNRTSGTGSSGWRVTLP